MIFRQFLGLLLACPSSHLLADNLLPLFFKHIRAAFEKQHAKNEVFILGRIHLAAQDIGDDIKVTFEFREG